MTNNHRHLTRALMIAALAAGVWTAAEAAHDSAAHADTKPGAIADIPGGVVGAAGRLPEQAAARAHEVVDQVLPEPPAPEPEPTTPAEPTTDDRSTEPEPEPTEPVVDVPPIEVPPVAIEAPPIVEDTPPVVVETPPVVDDPTPTEPAPAPEPVVVTLPTIDPSPLPDADAPAPKPRPQPIPAPVALPALPVQLPVVIGPIPAVEPPAAATVGEMPAAAITAAPPECDERRAIHLDRDLISQLIDSLTAPATQPAAKAKATPGCPDKPKPAPEQPGCTGTTTTSSNAGSNSGHMFADTTAALVLPTLDRLEHARARSTIPASRHVAVEPGPA